MKEKKRRTLGKEKELLPTPGWEKELPPEKTKGQEKEKPQEGPERQQIEDNKCRK